MAYKFIDNQNRGALSEGRSWGMGFSFALKEGQTFVNAYATSCCKDYLQDECHSQYSKANWNIYGLKSKFIPNLFNLKKKEAYLIFGVLPYNKGNNYDNQDRDTKALSDNLDNLCKFINWWEKKFKIKQKTAFHRLDVENRYVAIIPLWWTQALYRISFLTFLMRVAIFYDGKQDILNYLDDIKYCSEDKYLYNGIKKKVERMLKGELPEPKMSITDQCPHSKGICEFNFDKAADLYQKKEIIVKLPKKATDILQPMKF